MSSLSLFISVCGDCLTHFFRFELMPYTTTDTNNGKLLHVTISDTDYSKWVAKYRQEASKEEDGDADDDIDDIWRR